MRLGTPGFIPSRLSEARESRGLTKTALAEMLNLTKQAISRYEKGAASPSHDVLSAMSSTLNFPHHFFVCRPERDRVPITVFHRALSSTTKIPRERAKWKLAWLQDLALHLSKYLDFPEPRLFAAMSDLAPPKSLAEVEDVALRCRRVLGLGDGPISNTVLLLENEGTIVARVPLEADKMDALSAWCSQNDRPFILLGSDKNNFFRSRFDVCHELGHLLFHRAVIDGELKNNIRFNLIEQEAHRFAGAFLLPAESFLEDLGYPSLDRFLALKEKWKVSVKLMIKRCEDLGVLRELDLKRLYISYSRRGWFRHEPYDDTFVPEQPRLLDRSVQLVIQQKVQSLSDIVSSLGLPETMVLDLASLSKEEVLPQVQRPQLRLVT